MISSNHAFLFPSRVYSFRGSCPLAEREGLCHGMCKLVGAPFLLADTKKRGMFADTKKGCVLAFFVKSGAYFPDKPFLWFFFFFQIPVC